jgi:hypothetical protein
MVIGSAQNGYVREALKLVEEIRATLSAVEATGDKGIDESVVETLKIEIGDNLKRIEEQLTEAVKYGRDLFQEADLGDRFDK